MQRINLGRVILGGLVAGLVINIGESLLNMMVIAPDMRAALDALHLPQVGGPAIGIFVVEAFLLGIATIWLYAAIRPRYGMGAKTALRAGAAVWFFSFLYSGVGMAVMGFFPMRVEVVSCAWGLAEICIAAMAGGYLYRE
jgi:hypothetical protein